MTVCPLKLSAAAVFVSMLAIAWHPARSYAQQAAGQTAEGGATESAGALPDVAQLPFDAQTIRQVMQARTPEVQACYERVLAETRSRLQGRVMLQFVIGLEGEVSAAKVVRGKTTLRSARVHDCVLAVRGWRFPRPNDARPHPIEYPFDLKVIR